MDAMTPALRAELRHAATVIRDAVAGTRPAAPSALTSAHNTLTQRRADTSGDTRRAIDHYLDDETWHDGPRRLHHAAIALADTLGIAPLARDHGRWTQLSLFDPPADT